MPEKKNNGIWWAIIGALVALGLVFFGLWQCERKKPSQINTVIKQLPPRIETDWIHDTAVITEAQELWDTILNVDTLVLKNIAIDFVHSFPGVVGMGWRDTFGDYHYSHFDFPNARYGLHASVTAGVPSVTVYDFGKYVERDKKWRVELELGGGIELASVDANEKSLSIRPEAGTAARLVLGEYRLRRMSFEIIPVEVGVNIPGGFSAKVKARMIF